MPPTPSHGTLPLQLPHSPTGPRPRHSRSVCQSGSLGLPGWTRVQAKHQGQACPMQGSACRIPAVPWGRPLPCLFTDTHGAGLVLAWQTAVGLAGTLSRADSPVCGPLSPGGVSEESCRPCPAGSFCPSLGLDSAPGSCVASSECPLDARAPSPTTLLCPQVPPWAQQEGTQAPPRPGLRQGLSGPHRWGCSSVSQTPLCSPATPSSLLFSCTPGTRA